MKVYFGTKDRTDQVANLYAYFIIIGISIMMISNLFQKVLPDFFHYADEVYVLLCCILVIFHLLGRGKPNIYLLLLVLIIGIGLCGNMLFGIHKNTWSIILDVFLFSKPYIMLIFITMIVKQIDAVKVYRFLERISKMTLIVLGICSAISLYGDSPMNMPTGIFLFWADHPGTVSAWSILALAVAESNKANKRLFYYLIAAFIVIRADSGLGTLSIVAYIFIYLFFEKRERFKWRYLILIVPVCLWVGRNEISGYLMNRDAARFLLFYYAFVTAIDYFPFGSGFATYCSPTAAFDYSPLYYKYGFNHQYMMNDSHRNFLQDAYFPQVIGQFGFIGSVLFILMLYIFFRKRLWTMYDPILKGCSLYLFAVWFVTCLGFGVGSNWGCAAIAVVMILHLYDERLNIKRGSINC